jgi:hypothetical protein
MEATMSAKHFADMKDDLLTTACRHHSIDESCAECDPVAYGVEHFRGRLVGEESIRRFIEAGNATITVVSKKSRTRFTFRFSRPSEEDARARNQHFAVRPIWVSLLNGSDNESNYAFMGTIFPTRSMFEVVRSAKSRVGTDAPSWTAMQWFVESLYRRPQRLFDLAEVWHEGRCGRCGRKLTVPESVMTGFGPDCAELMGL